MAENTRYYETLYLVRNDINEQELSTIQEKLNDAVNSSNGEIYKSEKWDERDLAYPIKDYTKGIYYIMTYKANPSVTYEMEKHLRFYSNEVLRFMTVAVDREQAVGDKQEATAAEEGGVAS